MAIAIRQFPCLNDNYGFLIRDEATGVVAAVDTPEVDAINAELDRAGWRLDLILNTHHHWDHAGGNLALKERWVCEIVAPKGEAEKISGVDRAVGDGDRVAIGETVATVIETPGHTLGHIIYHVEDEGVAFVGDTIFAMGCGRLFEGTPDQMWASLGKVAALPPETTLYCAHEYTKANAAFAMTIDPHNEELAARTRAVGEMRARGEPTVPTDVARELATNPFLRARDPRLQAALGMTGAAPVDVFAETRRRKDAF